MKASYIIHIHPMHIIHCRSIKACIYLVGGWPIMITLVVPPYCFISDRAKNVSFTKNAELCKIWRRVGFPRHDKQFWKRRCNPTHPPSPNTKNCNHIRSHFFMFDVFFFVEALKTLWLLNTYMQPLSTQYMQPCAMCHEVHNTHMI